MLRPPPPVAPVLFLAVATASLGTACEFRESGCNDTGFSGANLRLHMAHDWQPGDHSVLLAAGGNTIEHSFDTDGNSSDRYKCEGPDGNPTCYYYDCSVRGDTIDCTYGHWGPRAPDQFQVTITRDGAILFDDQVATQQEVRHPSKEECGPDGVNVDLSVAF